MAETVCLVDGVGRPKLLDIEQPGATILYGKTMFVKAEEVDPDGRSVYRMRAVYRPAIRVDFLKLSVIEPFNPPRREA